MRDCFVERSVATGCRIFGNDCARSLASESATVWRFDSLDGIGASDGLERCDSSVSLSRVCVPSRALADR